VIPLLQKRGRFRRSYEEKTFRERFGFPRPERVLSAGARSVASLLQKQRIPPAWAAFPGTGRMNHSSVFVDGTVRGSVHKFGYGHKQGAAATPLVA
jgi:hypothetical protein